MAEKTNPILDKNGELNEIYFDDEEKQYYTYVDGVPKLVDAGQVGPRGPAGTIAVGNVTTVEQDKADVVNVGTDSEAVFDFYLPKGDVGPQGEKGDTSTIHIGTVMNGPVPNVTNVGTDTDAIFDFVLPKGEKGDKGEDAIAAIIPRGNWLIDTEYVQSDYVTANDMNAYVCLKDHTSSNDNEPPNAEFWQLIALQGSPGRAATIEVGQTSPGKVPVVRNVGTTENAILDFEIPIIEISQEAGNIIEEKDDGLYVNPIAVEVSQKDGNITSMEDDGLYSTVKIEKDTETIKLTKANGDEIANTKLNYLSLERLDKYVYKATFNDVPNIDKNINVAIGGCTSFIQDGKLYRNFDFKYNDDATFIVKTNEFTGTAYIPGLTHNKLNDKLLGQLPYHLADGINNKGIMVASHLVYNDFNYKGNGILPTWAFTNELLHRLNAMTFDAASITAIFVNAYQPDNLGDYAIMFFISDGEKTFVAEPRGVNQYVVKDISANPKLTNFFWQERLENVGLTTYQNVTDGDRPNGVERFLAANDLKELKFTNCYDVNKLYISEFIGMNNTTKRSTPNQLITEMNKAIAEYTHRLRDGVTWQTVHSVVYDAKKGMEHLWTQEDFNKDYVASTSAGGAGSGIAIQPEAPDDTNVWIDTDEEFEILEAFEQTPVGTINPFLKDGNYYGWLKCDGATYNIADYVDLFNVIKNQYGGDGVTTFKVPKLTDNRYLRGSTSAGNFQDPALPNIKGTVNTSSPYGVSASGAFTFSKTGPDAWEGSAGGSGPATFNASRSSTIYKDNHKDVTPRNMSVIYYIKAVKTYSMDIDGKLAKPIIEQAVVDTNVYSTNDTIIGKWIDGRPIYRRVFSNLNITVNQSTSDAWVQITNYSIPNSTCIKSNGTIQAYVDTDSGIMSNMTEDFLHTTLERKNNQNQGIWINVGAGNRRIINNLIIEYIFN